jgi:aryl-alcohol dehydrogenase-like predicted oxidoreductase
LRIDVVPVFLLFWARSAGRLADDALLALERLREEGKLHQTGLSTHDRGLAREALGLGFEVLMVRHNAAHRGAEEQVFPAARASGAGVLTFSCTCYGRLLIERPGFGPAPAPDMYRYSLASPGVSAAIMAPRTPAELRENLAVLRAPGLDPGVIADLRRRGDSVYRESRLFFELLRSR